MLFILLQSNKLCLNFELRTCYIFKEIESHKLLRKDVTFLCFSMYVNLVLVTYGFLQSQVSGTQRTLLFQHWHWRTALGESWCSGVTISYYTWVWCGAISSADWRLGHPYSQTWLGYLFPSLTGWTRVWLHYSEHMATLACSIGLNLVFYAYLILSYWHILWWPITHKIRIEQKNVIEEKLLEIKRTIRRGIYLFQIHSGHFSV